jgi:hypothetical protein
MDILRKLQRAFYRIGRVIAKRCVRWMPLSALGGRHSENLQVDHIGHGQEQWNLPTNLVGKVFCVEFDSPTFIFRMREVVRLLFRVGLSLVQRRRDHYLFVNRVILESLK